MVNIRGPGSLYIVQEREHIAKFVNSSKCQVVKIGRTHDVPEQMKAYPKGSLLLACLQVNNMLRAETVFINVCSVKFSQRRDLGREYFECELNHMQHVLCGIVLHQFQFKWNDQLTNENCTEHNENNNKITDPQNECSGHISEATCIFHEFVQNHVDLDAVWPQDAMGMFKNMKRFCDAQGCHAKISYKSFRFDLERYYLAIEIPVHSFPSGMIGPAFHFDQLNDFVEKHEQKTAPLYTQKASALLDFVCK